jgi:hypothetical protein
MSRCSTRAGGRDQDLQVEIGFNFKKINLSGQGEIFCIIPSEVRRFCARGMDSINPAVRAEGGLHLHLAEVTMATGYPSIPENLISNLERRSMDISLLPIQLNNFSHSFMAWDHWELDARIPSFPHMNI